MRRLSKKGVDFIGQMSLLYVVCCCCVPLLFSCLAACTGDQPQIQKVAYVYKVRRVPFSRQYFKLRIFYRFQWGDSTCSGDFVQSKRTLASEYQIGEGDSLVVQFPAGYPERSVFWNVRFSYRQTKYNEEYRERQKKELQKHPSRYNMYHISRVRQTD